MPLQHAQANEKAGTVAQSWGGGIGDRGRAPASPSPPGKEASAPWPRIPLKPSAPHPIESPQLSLMQGLYYAHFKDGKTEVPRREVAGWNQGGETQELHAPQWLLEYDKPPGPLGTSIQRAYPFFRVPTCRVLAPQGAAQAG